MDNVVIEGFWDYSISPEGEVINNKTDRIMTLSPTENGDLTVGLIKDGIQYRRSVKVLVARAFVEGETEIFDTPIQLDGNKNNLRADNIVWRPRWFAWRYTRQFEEPHPYWYNSGPVVDIMNRLRYRSVFSASTINGVLCEDVYRSTINEQRVFPTGQIFVFA